ncbi:GIY-YIG nuclease family protein [Sphingomonas sp.]|uniref:GIY-YIG nuclease family protein n=1 Tax=Sphingomonas sp. TaxID=28214 RepID=UPI0031D150AF
MEKQGFVYIMASRRNGTIYIGVTSDLPKRVWEHRNGVVEGFTKRYGCKLLVWYQAFDSLDAARHRELQMKEWKRAWKLREIEGLNPEWNDLFDSLAPS